MSFSKEYYDKIINDQKHILITIDYEIKQLNNNDINKLNELKQQKNDIHNNIINAFVKIDLIRLKNRKNNLK